MNDFDKKLDFDSNTFENMKHDMNFVLQRLLGNMIEKQSKGWKSIFVQPGNDCRGVGLLTSRLYAGD